VVVVRQEKMKEKKANTDMCRLRQTTKWPARYKIL